MGDCTQGVRFFRLVAAGAVAAVIGLPLQGSAAGLRHADDVQTYARAMASIGQCRAFLSDRPVSVQIGGIEQAALAAASADEAEAIAYDALFRETYALEVVRAREESLRDGGGFCRQIMARATRAEAVFRQQFLDSLAK